MQANAAAPTAMARLARAPREPASASSVSIRLQRRKEDLHCLRAARQRLTLRMQRVDRGLNSRASRGVVGLNLEIERTADRRQRGAGARQARFDLLGDAW